MGISKKGYSAMFTPVDCSGSTDSSYLYVAFNFVFPASVFPSSTIEFATYVIVRLYLGTGVSELNILVFLLDTF